MEQVRIRVELAGKTQQEIGALIGLENPNRAWELFTGQGAFRELHELRHKARAIVEDLTPCPRGVYRRLSTGTLEGPLAGVIVRWTRIVLDYPLRAWVKRHGMSTWWWSKFENSTGDSLLRALGTLYPSTIAAIQNDMLAAAAKMQEVPSWRPLGGTTHDDEN